MTNQLIPVTYTAMSL